VELADAGTVAERCFAGVACAGVDTGQPHRLVATASARAHRPLPKTDTESARMRAPAAGIVDREGGGISPHPDGWGLYARVYMKGIVSAPRACALSGPGSSVRSRGAESRSSPRR